jgi:hypothetical protein
MTCASLIITAAAGVSGNVSTSCRRVWKAARDSASADAS